MREGEVKCWSPKIRFYRRMPTFLVIIILGFVSRDANQKVIPSVGSSKGFLYVESSYVQSWTVDRRV